jgi:small-conductance mechanosensitive channel
MMFVANWSEIFTRSLQGIWLGVASFVPSFVFAVVIFVVGWIVAVLIEKIVEAIFRLLKVDSALRAAGIEDTIKRAGYNLNSGRFVGSLVKWFVIVVFLVASFDVLQLTQVNEFLSTVVLYYLPKVIVAVLILLVAIVVAEATKKVVIGSARAAHLSSANFLGSVAKWAIWIFAILTVLFQLGIAAPFVQTLFMGVVVAVSLAVGLSFGLGGKEAASEVISKLKHEVQNHQ